MHRTDIVTGTKLKTRISVPANASRGELLEIKTLISHPMESGFRRDAMGEPVPRNILEQFVCTYNGKEVFSAELYPAIAANPFLSFFIRAKQSGVLDFRWTDQHGQVTHESSSITVA